MSPETTAVYPLAKEVRTRRERMKNEADAPSPIFGRAGALGFSGEGDPYLLVGRGPAPNLVRPVALQDHVRLKQILHTKAVRDGGELDHIFFWHSRVIGGEADSGEEQKQEAQRQQGRVVRTIFRGAF